MSNRTIGLLCQLAGTVLGLICLITIVQQRPLTVLGLCIGGGLYFIGRYIKDRL